MRSDFIPVDHMKLVSLNDSPWFDAMIRNTGNNQSAQRADMSSNLAYSPITIIRDAFNQIQLNPEAHWTWTYDSNVIIARSGIDYPDITHDSEFLSWLNIQTITIWKNILNEL